MYDSTSPIGIFDSGIGGLTVAHAVAANLPHENLIYFGDTAHLPYGDKSTAAIQAYAIKICDMLLQKNCKVILIACNSAASAAYELVKEYVGSRSHVLNVIDPVINHLRESYAYKKIGLIGTKQTIFSNVYQKKIDALNMGIELKSLATPLLVPAIEEGFGGNLIITDILHEYLSHSDLVYIEALILGCTHYPLIKEQIINYYKNKTKVIDSAKIMAQALKTFLDLQQLNNQSKQKHSTRFFISDYTDAFTHATKLFFGEELSLEHYPLWE
jgi:glutamate racemase